MLGRGAADEISDHRVTVCAAGWCEELGLIRIYPTRLTSPLKQWQIVSIPVERNPADTRAESWKIQGSRAEWDNLDAKIKVVGELDRPERRGLVRKLVSPCVSILNENHVSLGIIDPKSLRGYLSEREDVPETVQQTLWGRNTPKTKASYAFQPRLEYRCSGCVAADTHDQQIIEIGCYEWFRKNPGYEAKVFDNLQLYNPGWAKYLLVGNQANHRTSYLVINVIRWKRSAEPLALE